MTSSPTPPHPIPSLHSFSLSLSLFHSLTHFPFLLFNYAMHHSFHHSHSPLQSAMPPPIVVISKFRSQRKKHARSQTRVSEGPWKSETPFGPPHVPSFPGSGIRRIRNTLSKLSPAARAERELLRQKNRHKSPLTERNITNFVSEQEIREIYYPTDNSTEFQVTAWLEQLS